MRSLPKPLKYEEWPLWAKIGIVVAYSFFSAFLYRSFIPLAIPALILAMLNVKHKRGMYTALTIIFITTWINQAFFYYGYYEGQKVHVIFWVIRPNTPILGELTQGGVAFTLEGSIRGLIVGTKIITLFCLGMAFIENTSVRETLSLLYKRSPRLATIAAITIRYFPLIEEDMHEAYYGLVTRGYDPRFRNFVRTLKILMSTLVIVWLKRSKSIAIAAEFRGLFEKKEIR